MNDINKHPSRARCTHRRIDSRAARRFSHWITPLIGLLLIAGCTKIAPLYSLKIPNNNPDTTRDVRKMLDSFPGFRLFSQACRRTGLTDRLDPAVFYTLFIPSDSAMMAAGFTSDVINSLPVDSLARLLKYHITYGALSDTALTIATVSIQQNCLLDSLFFNPPATPSAGYSTYQHAVFVKNYGGVLNINGWAVNEGEPPIKASNGYLYPIHRVLQPPTQKLWDIINGRPELSYYLAAINFMDSIYIGLNNGRYFQNSDSVLFTQLLFEQIAGAQINNTSPVRPTVFAPTNTAFIYAGFPDIPSLQNYILGTIRIDTIYGDTAANPYNYQLNNIPGPGYQLLPNGGFNSVFNYFPLDSIFKMHYLFNANQQVQGPNGQVIGLSFSNALCYSDLTGSPSVNNGILNITTLNPAIGSGITPYTLHFSSGPAGILTIQWNAAGRNDAVIPKDGSQIDRRRNFWGLNGVIYESDRLFITN